MPAFKKHDLIFWAALLFAVWFALTSWYWGWLANVYLSFPIGLLSILLWFIGRRYDPRKQRYEIVGWILAAGVVSAVVTYLIFF